MVDMKPSNPSFYHVMHKSMNMDNHPKIANNPRVKQPKASLFAYSNQQANNRAGIMKAVAISLFAVLNINPVNPAESRYQAPPRRESAAQQATLQATLREEARQRVQFQLPVPDITLARFALFGESPFYYIVEEPPQNVDVFQQTVHGANWAIVAVHKLYRVTDYADGNGFEIYPALPDLKPNTKVQLPARGSEIPVTVKPCTNKDVPPYYVTVCK